MSKFLKELRHRLRVSKLESGMIDTVVAIPLSVTYLGLLFVSVGVVMGLVGDISQTGGATREANSAVNELLDAKNCGDLSSIVSKINGNVDEDSSFKASVDSYTCSRTATTKLTVNVKTVEEDKTVHSRTVIVAVN